MTSRRDFLGELWRGTGGALLAASALILHRALRAAAPTSRETTLSVDAVSRAIAEGGAATGGSVRHRLAVRARRSLPRVHAPRLPRAAGVLRRFCLPVSRQPVRGRRQPHGGAGPGAPFARVSRAAWSLVGGTTLTEAPAGGARSPSGDFGRLALGFLSVSILSGLALVPFFSPAHALESLERLHGGLPWGFFLRALHAYSSFGLLVTTVAHLVQVLARRTERQLSAGSWWRSVLLLPLTILALLSGFVLRGDAAAAEALPVWSRIAETVPFLGPELARLLLGVIPGDLGAISLHHAGTFTLLLWLITAEHGRRLVPDARALVLAGLVSAALAGTVPSAARAASGRVSRRGRADPPRPLVSPRAAGRARRPAGPLGLAGSASSRSPSRPRPARGRARRLVGCSSSLRPWVAAWIAIHGANPAARDG